MSKLPSIRSAPKTQRHPFETTALIADAFGIISGIPLVGLPALLVSTSAAIGIILTGSLAITAASAFIDEIMSPDGKPLAIFIGLVVTAFLAGLTWEIARRVRRRRQSSAPSD
ncbi:hypothetical protein JQ557_15665 [Bradyrhizobium sp. U87765 SZCCT0131]|uniref:hypothetical protein n=1 Tax=unclassified Bradyrhizobium TaxID=2631580 RepID=UPI001BAA9E19|nr:MULTISPECIES: hypothetical protein [unclassified Bradyrhizobium]MBR1219441.1 hypothetical protein [Bradyrhizobium sp. U87765 SZCCT0131]MBR1262092.1 hypothetical protein [Bradyrhizobium sp. U87765 SZCCT0134]MBR1306055.1 hypothetical protein [Bradyrhizobium sp. U87765 SZCCT0110]MBR1317874.1 hypothetical protein [Bradyrhizobium sp. U87765 SZCCT0109]MBR1351576.1 hypothetical protein [Bradyrhizobium sp. U87765 SZCCT0048]